MNNKPIAINFFGGPCAGKSTVSAGVFSLLKLHNIDTELVTEFAKDLVWEGHDKTFLNQRYIYGQQYHRMWRLKDEVDVIVTDSPLILSAIYGIKNNSVSNGLIADILDSVNEFNNVNIFLNRNNEYTNSGRNLNKKQANEVDNMIKLFFKENNIKYTKIESGINCINLIVKKILNMNNINRKYSINTV